MSTEQTVESPEPDDMNSRIRGGSRRTAAEWSARLFSANRMKPAPSTDEEPDPT